MSVTSRIFVAVSLLAMTGIVGLGALLAYWSLVTPILPEVEEPIPILNKDKQIAVNEPIVMQLAVNKPQFANVEQTTRFIVCTGGTLLPIAPSTLDLPVGTFVIPVSSTRLPAGVTPGAECRYTFRVEYSVNPVRSEFREWVSEPFTVVARED